MHHQGCSSIGHYWVQLKAYAYALYILGIVSRENSIETKLCIVDEEKFVALNIWVPLCDTDETNGTLYVLPGSQYGIVKAIRYI